MDDMSPRSGEEGAMEVEVVEGDFSSREEGGLGLGRGARVSAKVMGGPAVSSLGPLRPRIVPVGEFSLLISAELTAWLVSPGESMGLFTRDDLKLGLRFTEPDGRPGYVVSPLVGLSIDPS